jgi:hypothetical protein
MSPTLLSSHSTLTYLQFHDLQAEVRVEVSRAEAETKRVRTERDQALKALQDSKKEVQKHKEEILAYKASVCPPYLPSNMCPISDSTDDIVERGRADSELILSPQTRN